jgi:hypothetical protein
MNGKNKMDRTRRWKGTRLRRMKALRVLRRYVSRRGLYMRL